jgi:hypothetical protein
VQHVRTVLERAIRDTLTELADQLEREPDPLGIGHAIARGLRPSPLARKSHS